MRNFIGLFLACCLLATFSCKEAVTAEKAAARESLASAPAAATTTQTKAAKPAEAIPTGPTTSIEFSETTFDYGTITEGEKVEHIYKFKNTGKEPLVISNAKGSCGCTVPDWPKDPIAPGDAGEIKVVFNSKGKGSVEGSKQNKRVTVTANTDPVNTYLNIKGTVKKDPNAKPAKPKVKPTGKVGTSNS